MPFITTTRAFLDSESLPPLTYPPLSPSLSTSSRSSSSSAPSSPSVPLRMTFSSPFVLRTGATTHRAVSPSRGAPQGGFHALPECPRGAWFGRGRSEGREWDALVGKLQREAERVHRPAAQRSRPTSDPRPKQDPRQPFVPTTSLRPTFDRGVDASPASCEKWWLERMPMEMGLDVLGLVDKLVR